jgi:hypothetical protein
MNEKIAFTNYKEQERKDPTLVCSRNLSDKLNKNEEKENTITFNEFWKKYNMSNHVWDFKDL